MDFKKVNIIHFLLLLTIDEFCMPETLGIAVHVVDEEWGGAPEIGQLWVPRHTMSVLLSEHARKLKLGST